MHIDLLIQHAAQLIPCASTSPDGNRRARHGAAMRDLPIIADGALAVHQGEIVAVGTSDDLLPRFTADRVLEARGKVVLPGLVDPHTHLVYAGNRLDEFEQRIQGATYMEIMAQGGGINHTVQMTRTASLDRLVSASLPRLAQMLAAGTTTAEVKTGYGLDTDTELRLLEAIASLDRKSPVGLVPTFMGAHAIPPEYAGRTEAYVDLVVQEMLPAASAWYRESHFAAKGVPFFIDVFCEQNAFTVEQSRRILEAGLHHGLKVKAHVDEFTHLGGLALALDLGAVSVDHLDVTPAADFPRLADASTVAVVIPAVNFNLGSTHFADARGMIDAGAAVALTTDLNPGSAPCPSMPLVMAIACRYQKLLPAEALIASTINAAHAVGMAHRIGSLETGKQADVLILGVPDYRELMYQFGVNLVGQVIKRGVVVDLPPGG